MTPLNDLNLANDEIPALLLTAISDPYASEGLTDCRAIEVAIAGLDGALGPDIDVTSAGSDRLSPGRMAKSVVASFIPFRGVLREISGAAEQERVLRAAIYAGAVRRGFLKGLGQQKGCDYPARPAFTRVAISAPPAQPRSVRPRKGKVTVARSATADQPLAAAQSTTFVSVPVVQVIPNR